MPALARLSAMLELIESATRFSRRSVNCMEGEINLRIRSEERNPVGGRKCYNITHVRVALFTLLRTD
jgi:hypothetical protein